MQITIEDISPVEKRVDFELPWRDVAPKLEKAYDHLRREVHLKGFRPGKVPRSIIERLYRHQVEDDVALAVVVRTQVVRRLVDRLGEEGRDVDRHDDRWRGCWQPRGSAQRWLGHPGHHAAHRFW